MVDIIIPVWNELEVTKLCIESIRRNTDIPYRLIIIDNGSDEETKKYLESLKEDKSMNILLIRNGENLGFVKAVNQGLKVSDAKYVCILNNDTIVTKGWLSKMVEFSENHPDIGAINPVIKGKKGQDPPENIEEYCKRFEGGMGEYMEVDLCRGTCMLIKRGVIERVGFLDETYGLGYYEDNDYSRRIQLSGFKTVRLLDTVIWHFVEKSFSKRIDLSEITDRNRKIYESRWGKELVIIYPFPEVLPMERARSIQYMNTCLGFARNGIKVYMLVPDKSRDRKDLMRYYGLVDHENLKFRFIPCLRVNVGNILKITVNYIFCLSCFIHILRIIRKERRKDKERNIIVFVRHLKLADFLIQLKKLLNFKLLYEAHEIFTITSLKRNIKRTEEKVLKGVDGIISITENLKDQIQKKFKINIPVDVAPDGVDFKLYSKRCATQREKTVIYTGTAFSWKGVDTLIKAAKYIKGKILIVGLNEGDLKEMMAGDNDIPWEKIIAVGWIPPAKVRDYLNMASVAVVPNKKESISSFYTSPLKLFEYMASGIPVVASDLPSIREIIKDGETGILVEPDNPEKLAESINMLIENEELASRISIKAQELAQQYDWKKRGERIRQFIENEILKKS